MPAAIAIAFPDSVLLIFNERQSLRIGKGLIGEQPFMKSILKEVPVIPQAEESNVQFFPSGNLCKL